MKKIHNIYAKYIGAMCIVFLFFTFGSVQLGYAASSAAPDIFSDDYFRINLDLNLNTNDEEFDFLSHKWVEAFINDLFTRLQIISLFDNVHTREALFHQLKIEKEPLADIRSLGKVDSSVVHYEKIYEFISVSSLRKKFLLASFLNNLDKTLANIFLQERHLKTARNEEIRALYNKHYKNSFHNIKRNLLLLRNDLEMASLWIQTDFGERPAELQKAEKIIQQFVGRIFFVKKKGADRIIRQTGTGTIVEHRGRKVILTCRHFDPIDDDCELEIYFIPHELLSSEDYLPIKRKAPQIVDWDQYEELKVVGLHLRNTPEMTSEVFIKGEEEPRKINANQAIVLNLGDIVNLKKIEDNVDNNDIAFMQVANPDILRYAARLEFSNIDFRDPHLYSAGYPGNGLSDYSLAVVGASKSEYYQQVINRHDRRLEGPHWHYKIAGFPTNHGMSGGPVFLIASGVPIVFASLTGVDFESLGTLCTRFTSEDLESIS